MSAPPAPVRWTGLDLARGLAVVGMVVAHLQRPAGLAGDLVTGLPSALFAVLAGASLGLLGDDAARRGGPDLARSRHALLVRGALLVALGVALQPWTADVVVVLGAIGVALMLLSPAPAWPTPLLVQLLVLLVGASAVVRAMSLARLVPYSVLTGVYPLAAWCAYLCAGLLLHRHLHRVAARPVVVVLPGAAVAVAAVLGRAEHDLYRLADPAAPWPDSARRLLDPTPHGGGLLDVLAGGGAALTVVGLCLALAGHVSVAPLLPIARLGRMSLSVYTGHVLTAGLVLGERPDGGHTLATVVTVVLAAGLATAWGEAHPRGPLEEVVRQVVTHATDPRHPGRSPEPR